MEAAADRLCAARRDPGALAAPLSGTWPHLTIDDAYAIQARVRTITCASTPPVGWKIGLTDPDARRAFGATESVYGWLSADMARAHDLRAPKLEVELAAVIGEPTSSANTSIAELRLAFEIVDTRYRTGPATLVDLIADNANAAAFVLGDAIDHERATVPIEFEPEGSPPLALNASPAAALSAVSWLEAAAARHGNHLNQGDIVLTGSLTTAFDVAPGQAFRAHAGEAPGLELTLPSLTG